MRKVIERKNEKKSLRRRLATAGTVFALLLGAVGCGASGSANSEAPATEAKVEATEEATEEVTEAAVEAVSEPEPETLEPEPENAREKRYFTFVTSTTYTVLRVREAPSEDAAIIHKLSKKTPGYVLQPGNTWSKVVTAKGSIGYCATEYLDMTEVSPEDFPQEYRDMVLAPEEDLSY